MSATITSPAAPKLAPTPASPLTPARPVGAPSAGVQPVNPHHRGGRVLFEIRFTSPMSDVDVASLRQVLDISTHMYPKMRPDPNSPGVARLDHHSGLFLERGPAEGQWVMQARTWGRPAPRTVHEWHLLAAEAARRLDPRVALPERLANPQPPVAERPLGQAADKRLPQCPSARSEADATRG